VSSYDAIKDLPVEIEGYELEGLEFHPEGTDFDRLTTIIHLKGGGQEGLGEDVVYDALDHVAFQDAGPVQIKNLFPALFVDALREMYEEGQPFGSLSLLRRCSRIQ